jgi:hypothetical protein
MDTAPAPQRFWQNFGGGKDDMEHVPGDQHNMYTELQTGVMPTQYAYPCLAVFQTNHSCTVSRQLNECQCEQKLLSNPG